MAKGLDWFRVVSRGNEENGYWHIGSGWIGPGLIYFAIGVGGSVTWLPHVPFTEVGGTWV